MTTINWLINRSVKAQLVANYLYTWLIIKVIFPSKNVTHLLLKCEVVRLLFVIYDTHIQSFGLLFGENKLLEDTNLGSAKCYQQNYW